MTVGELRKALEDVPDTMLVVIPDRDFWKVSKQAGVFEIVDDNNDGRTFFLVA